MWKWVVGLAHEAARGSFGGSSGGSRVVLNSGDGGEMGWMLLQVDVQGGRGGHGLDAGLPRLCKEGVDGDGGYERWRRRLG